MLKKRILAVVFPLLITLGCAALPLNYITPAFEATVVDADTGQPIEGAIVVANWQVVEGLLHGTRDRGSLETKETVTDRNGRFRFDETSVVNSTGYPLRNQDPQIVIFKPGYTYFAHRNQYSGTFPELEATRIRGAQLSNRSIKLNSIANDFRKRGFEYSDAISRLPLPSTFNTKDCSWKKMPRMMITMDEESRRLKNQTIIYYRSPIDKIVNESACGNPRDFFKEISK